MEDARSRRHGTFSMILRSGERMTHGFANRRPTGSVVPLRPGKPDKTKSCDTTPITTAIARMIAAGTPEGEIPARVVRTFPNLTLAELSAALQDATAAAERQATRRH
jgi:hypothetical protein